MVLNEKLPPLKSEMSDLREKVGEMTTFLDMANAKYEEVISKLKQSEAQRAQIMEENKVLRNAALEMDKKVKHLNESLDDLEQYSRRDCLEIRGIPPATVGQPENTNEIIVKLGRRQPRSQGLSFCHLGETLAAAGHVPPRFWEVNLIVTVRGVGKERVCSVLKLQLG
jgi:seryl-tRNA synthetase